MLITNNAYNGLNKIASASKMDCWFSIRETTRLGQKHDCVYDIEAGKQVGWKDALNCLFDGITEPLDSDFYGLTPDEITAVKALFEKYGIEFDGYQVTVTIYPHGDMNDDPCEVMITNQDLTKAKSLIHDAVQKVIDSTGIISGMKWLDAGTHTICVEITKDGEYVDSDEATLIVNEDRTYSEV